jgi:nucleoside 2-deoxyribosyltransferase
MKTVYLAGPIFGKTDEECKTWRTMARTALAGIANVRDPVDRDFRGHERDNARRIVEGDIRDIEQSDIVLVMCSEPSWGTAMEMRLAFGIHKTIVAVVPDKSSVSPWVRYHATVLYERFDEALSYIASQAGHHAA